MGAGKPRHGVKPQQKRLTPKAWRHWSIEGAHPYLYLGIVLRRTGVGEVRNVSLLVAISVDVDGYRQILGIVEGAMEGVERISRASS